MSYLSILFKNLFENKAYYPEEKLHDKHLMATEKCINVFESSTINDKELNNDYENLLGNDIRGLYASCFMVNNSNMPKTDHFSQKVKEAFTPMTVKFINFKHNLLHTKKYNFKEKASTAISNLMKSKPATIPLEIAKFLLYFYLFIITSLIKIVLASCYFIYRTFLKGQINYSIDIDEIVSIITSALCSGYKFLIHQIFSGVCSILKCGVDCFIENEKFK